MRYKLAWEKAYTHKEAYAERVTFSKDGKYIVAQIDLYQGGLVAWNARTGEEVEYNKESLPETGNPRVSPDGRLKAVIDGVNIKIVDASTGRLLHTLSGHGSSVNSVAFSPDGRLLAYGRYEQVQIWEVASGRLLHTLSVYGSVNSVAFSPDGRLLASGIDKTVKIWGPA